MSFNKKLLATIRIREAVEKVEAEAARIEAAVADGMPALEAVPKEEIKEEAKDETINIAMIKTFTGDDAVPSRKIRFDKKMQCSYEYNNPQAGQNARCNRQIAPGFSRMYCGKHAIHDKAVQRYWPRCTRGRSYSIHKMTKRGRVWPWAFLTEVIRIMDIMEQIWGYKNLTDLDKFIASMPLGFEGPRCQFCMVADNAEVPPQFSDGDIDEITEPDMMSPITPGQYFPDMETPLGVSPTARQYSWGVATNMAGAVLSPVPQRQYSWGGAVAPMHDIPEDAVTRIPIMFQFNSNPADGPRAPAGTPRESAIAKIPVDEDGKLMVSFQSTQTGGPHAPKVPEIEVHVDPSPSASPVVVAPAFPIGPNDTKVVPQSPIMTDTGYAQVKKAADALSLNLDGLNAWRVGKAFVRTGDEESRNVLLEYLASCS